MMQAKWSRGGDGLIREIRFVEPASLSILSQHRRVAPFGISDAPPFGYQETVLRVAHVIEGDSVRVYFANLNAAIVAAGSKISAGILIG